MYEKGCDRTERGLDVRNIIKSQETIKSMLHTMVPSKEKRKLMRLQRRAVVLEPVSSSSDSEDDFSKYKSFYKQFQKRFKFYDDDAYGQGDSVQKKLLNGVLDRNALIGRKSKKKSKHRGLGNDDYTSEAAKSVYDKSDYSKADTIRALDKTDATLLKSSRVLLGAEYQRAQTHAVVESEREMDGIEIGRKKTQMELYQEGKQTQSGLVHRAVTNLDDLADLDDIMTQKEEK